MASLLHVTPRSLLFLQATVVIGVPLLIWRFAAVPVGIGRSASGRRALTWFSISTVFPLAVVQIFAGVLLGPSIFKQVWPDGYDFLFRQEVRHTIETIANIAIVLLVFIAGCETDRAMLKRSAGTLLKIGASGVFVPWIVGTVAAFGIVALFHTPRVVGTLGNPVLFAVAFGLCMSVTALPILLILCREMGILQQPIGSIALAVAGIDDILLWLSIAIIMPFATAGSSLFASFLLALGGGATLIVVLAFVISPYMDWLIKKEAPERFLMSATILVLFMSVLTADLIGLHAVVGAFVAGMLLPSKVRHMSNDRLDVPVNLILMPFFFLATGLRTEFSFTDPTVWSLVAIGLTATLVGKLLGVSLPVYLSGQSWPFSTMLGILMQCKGLMEILVITVMRERGIVGDLTFSALVLVAMISNAITSPLALTWIRLFGRDAYEARGNLAAATTVSILEPAKPVTLSRYPVLSFGGDIGDVPIAKNGVVIGRHSEDDVRINDISVSRRHARLQPTGDGRFEIVNQTAVRSEPNPIWVNGVEVEHAPVAFGDVVKLGGVSFVLRQAAREAEAA